MSSMHAPPPPTGRRSVPRSRLRPWAPLAVLGLIAAATTASVALAQSPAFVPGGDFDLVVGGVVDPGARIYESQVEAALLVVSDRLPTPVVLHVRSRGVQGIPAARLEELGRGLSIRRGDPLDDLGTFVVEGTEVRFSHGSTAAALRPKPALVGEHDLAELLEHTPKYRADAAAYAPDPAILGKLREVDGDYRVVVVFGSWCSVCKTYLPRGLAIDQALDDGAIRFEYLGLPLENPWETAEVKKLGVKALPTAIVYRGNDEIARFAGGEEWDRPEKRLLEAIAGTGGR
jgi:thiol-disulfide isomerase/thioredoxin